MVSCMQEDKQKSVPVRLENKPCFRCYEDNRQVLAEELTKAGREADLASNSSHSAAGNRVEV